MAITYEDITRANKTLKTTDIKGTDYIEVNERVKAFRMVYPTGTIETNMLSHKDGVIVCHAMVGYHEADQLIVLATGIAYEKEGSSYINKTSYIENCETSAIGRALGFAGFGIDTSIASYEEVANDKLNQGEKLATEKQKQLIKKLLETDDGKAYLSENYKGKTLNTLTVEDASTIISALKG